MRNFHYGPLQISLVITSLIEISQETDIIHKLNIVTDDPDDNIILETAVDGEAHYIITGDKHLLNLKSYQDIPAVTASEFLNFPLK